MTRARATLAAGWLCVLAALAWSTARRFDIVAAGPDPDIDAYKHLVLAGRFADAWRDVTLHWVWLPLWHAVGAALLRAGAVMDDVRRFSAACVALACVALTGTLRHHAARTPDDGTWRDDARAVLPYASGVAFALWPLNLQTGASAEPEGFFMLLVVASVACWERARFTAAGIALTLASLTRYEAWPLIATFAVLWATGARTPRGAVTWVLPAVAVAAWCVAHRAQTGVWAWFLQENARYVAEAWRTFRLAERAPLKVRAAPFWYVAIVPAVALKAATPALAPGAWWLARHGPRALATTAATLLATVTFVWVTRRNFGLERHFAALVPAYAVMAGAGLSWAGAWALQTLGARRRVALSAVLVAVAVSFAATRGAFMTQVYAGHARAAWVRERAVASVLRAEAAGDATVFCDDAQVEVLSGLATRRFVRWKGRDVLAFNLLVERVHHGDAWALLSRAQRDALGDLVEVRWGDNDLALVRVRPSYPRKPRLARWRSARLR